MNAPVNSNGVGSRTNHYDVLIVGGGMVGGLLCAALATLTARSQQPLRIAVVENRLPEAFPAGTTPEYDLRVSALSIASEQMLRNVGAWDGIVARRACEYSRLSVWDGEQAGRTEFNAADVQASHLGHIVENRVIQLALLASLEQWQNVSIISPASLSRIQVLHDRVNVVLNNNSELSAKLLVGADGANSLVRKQAGIAMERKNYPQHALVATVQTALAQQDITWQRFVPSGPQAMLPLCGSKASLVWYHTENEIERLMALPDAQFLDELSIAFPEELGVVERLESRGSFPIAKAHAATYIAPRVALVGDAAHTVHPLAGQGVNLGMLDAGTLADVISTAHNKGRSFTDQVTLRRYQRTRFLHNQVMISTLDSLYELFKSRPLPVREVRSLSLNAINHFTPLKNQIMRYAMGVEGELPSLARPLHSKIDD